MISYVKRLMKEFQNNVVFNPNKVYEKKFNEVKYNMLKARDGNKEMIDSFPFEMQPILLNEININEYNIVALKKLNRNNEVRGLCAMLSSLTLEGYAMLLNQDFAFLTVGKVLDENNNNIFNVPEKENVINDISKNQREFDNSLVGGNLHVWITLGNGMIIDPSITLTIYEENDVVIGFPKDISKKYIYEPYMLLDMIEVSEINKVDYYPKEAMFNHLINEKFETLKII